MTGVDDPFGFLSSPRAAKALRDAGYHNPQEASQASDADLLSLPGFGATSLKALRQRFLPRATGSGASTQVAEPPTPEQVEAREEFNLDWLNLHAAHRAERFFTILADKATNVTARLVQTAWELSDVFTGEELIRCETTAGGRLVLAEGVVVFFRGAEYVFRISLRAGEELPPDAVTVALVPK